MNHSPRIFHMYLKLFHTAKSDCRWRLCNRRLVTWLRTKNRECREMITRNREFFRKNAAMV